MARIPSRPGVEVSERVREAIRADIETANFVAVARDVTDVNDVVDQLEVVGLD